MLQKWKNWKNCAFVGAPFSWGPLFGRTCWTCLNPPLVAYRCQCWAHALSDSDTNVLSCIRCAHAFQHTKSGSQPRDTPKLWGHAPSAPVQTSLLGWCPWLRSCIAWVDWPGRDHRAEISTGRKWACIGHLANETRSWPTELVRLTLICRPWLQVGLQSVKRCWRRK